ncbi:hypothetical protein J5500_02305 [Candidatus Saccharibacteria bacterium]|nr:hypothetical protein [Candidatus Saccharibacteria bacterium]
MAKEMGEFEERPKMQEATPIPLRRRRPTGWIVATFLFAVIAVAAISFIIIDKLSSKEEPGVAKCENKESEEPVATKKTFSEKSDFDALMSSVKEIFEDNISKVDAIKVDDKGVKGAYLKIDDGFYTTLDSSRNVHVSHYDGIDDDIDEFGDKIEKSVNDLLKENGFVLDTSTSGSLIKYYTQEDGGICEYISYYQFSVICGNRDWISEENKELVKELWASYSKKEKPSSESRTVLSAKSADIKKSKTAGYERLSTGISNVNFAGGAMAYFYRKDGGKWQYVLSTQNVLLCESFDADAAKAFAGDECYSNKEKKDKILGK